jgi:hypothetical protein
MLLLKHLRARHEQAAACRPAKKLVGWLRNEAESRRAKLASVGSKEIRCLSKNGTIGFES